jgi:hypothetical protein
MSISRHQAAELRRRIEKALDATWDAGHSDHTEDGPPAALRSEEADRRLFRYVDHLAKSKSKSR